MRVICIDDRFQSIDIYNNTPVYGEIVTASQCPKWDDCYEILEYLKTLNSRSQSFRKILFAPLSTIDETEILEQRTKEFVKCYQKTT